MLAKTGFTPGLNHRKELQPHTHRLKQAAAPRRRCIRVYAENGKNVVIVGGGWAGFGAAKHLSECGYNTTLLDAKSNPGGLSSGFRTKKGQAVEAGIKGFWYSYKNIFKLVEELNLPEWPFTDWTNSGFWSPKGLVTEAPVFSRQAQLPTFLGQSVHTVGLHWSISLPDRLTMIPFLGSFFDYNTNEETYKEYDSMSAYELYRRTGVSREAYEQFLRPTLLVGLFAPPESVSAAVMLETLWYYVMAHQNYFDVCWCKGSVAERIFAPLVQRIRGRGGKVHGNQLVTSLNIEEIDGVPQVTAVEATDRETGETTIHQADAVVLAVGINAMQKLITANPPLAAQNDFSNIMHLKSLDVIATRLFFDRPVPTKYPANVLSGFEPAAGATFFNLNEIQDEYRNAEGSVITVDFYNASALLPLTDEALIQRVRSHLEKCEPGFKGAKVVDSVVLRYPNAVTHFSPGSYPDRPFQTTSIPNIMMAGDWVRGLQHDAAGLSQERALVSGLSAANLVVERLGGGEPATILDADPDEPHVALTRQLVTQTRRVTSFPEILGLRNPFL
ncbi:hypothetical protein DUNSADRAFT_10187 [Dunaliella salina]|uniref:Amine oxidase domain-containing protein n=1 Tax=Dunaliella salina TaxID=3046 RepID=A0ABQ7GFW6_DUNSA|nr:hypothetical protein DUNSADRAFT_10187 [Dunaliella salina]|eukprot:KAF5833500.1 hypothetical protein DUNSADRAFT_10187 [Dunaliella salina]